LIPDAVAVAAVA